MRARFLVGALILTLAACGDPAGEHPANPGAGNAPGAGGGGNNPGVGGGSDGSGGSTQPGSGGGSGNAPGSGGGGNNTGSGGSDATGGTTGSGGGGNTGGSGTGGTSSSDCRYTGSKDAVAALYPTWKEKHVVPAGGDGMRVQRPQNNNDTVSEGIAYGMLIAVYMDDRETLDGLWQYYKAKSDRAISEGGIMHWKWNANGTLGDNGQGGATDAEQDAAWALLVADKKWGGTYLQDARHLIQAMWDREVHHDGDWHVLKPGTNFSGGGVLNPSYFAPAYYRVFATVTNNPGWNAVVDSSYAKLNESMNPTTGLVPNWIGTNSYEHSDKYTFDASRTPWRIGQDYCWNGEPRARAYAETITAFFQSVGVREIVDGYELNGTPMPNRNTYAMTFTGPAAVGAMAAGRSLFAGSAYAFTLEIMGRPEDPAYSYYNATVGLISLMQMTDLYYELE